MRAPPGVRANNRAVILVGAPLAAILIVGTAAGQGGAAGRGRGQRRHGAASRRCSRASTSFIGGATTKLRGTKQQRLVQALIARAPNEYGVLWRAARFYFWASDDPGVAKEQRSRWGKDGWDLAERAIVINPNDVAGLLLGGHLHGQLRRSASAS